MGAVESTAADRTNGAEINPDELRVVVGLPGDKRCALTPANGLVYELANEAWEYQEQGSWPDEQHAMAWSRLLRYWPPLGRPNTVEGCWRVVLAAHNDLQLTYAEIALLFGIAADTVRRNLYVEKAEEVARSSPLNGWSLGSDKELAIERAPRGPFVYRPASQSAPDLVVFNDKVRVIDPNVDEGPNVQAAWALLDARRSEMWATGELAFEDGLLVRAGDRAGAIAALRRRLAETFQPGEIDEVIIDAIDRRKLPEWATAGIADVDIRRIRRTLKQRARHQWLAHTHGVVLPPGEQDTPDGQLRQRIDQEEANVEVARRLVDGRGDGLREFGVELLTTPGSRVHRIAVATFASVTELDDDHHQITIYARGPEDACRRVVIGLDAAAPGWRESAGIAPDSASATMPIPCEHQHPDSGTSV